MGLMHLLKWRFQPERRSDSWRRTLQQQRRRIASLLEHSPSLHRYVDESVAKRHMAAVVDTAEETGLDVSRFPTANPFSVGEILDRDFLPADRS
ncbi:MAG: hypothetical protein JWQ11_654 [Rhizobacter sp.]|nr:hypothetical protein [Rhizobacter sp.]